VSLRISDADLQLIDQLAAEHGLDRTAYMVRASTGELHDPVDLDGRLQAIENRLGRVERMADLGAFE
jgi:hypothetical protein